MKFPTSEPGESVRFHRKISNISLASGSGILTKEDEIECVCKEVRNAARKVGQKSAEENEGTNFGNQHWSLNDFNIGPVISKGCSAVVYAANCLKNGFETIGNDSEGMKEIRTHSLDLTCSRNARNFFDPKIKVIFEIT